MARNVQSVERAARILDLLATSGRGVGVAEVAETVGLPKTTVHGLLATLRSIGWVEQDGPSSDYRISRRLSGLGEAVDEGDLRSVATPWMDRLASETGLEVQLVRLDRARAVVVQHVYRPDNSPQRSRVGEALPLHATASGKVLLAELGGVRPDLRSATDRPEPFTRFTITDPADLQAELTRVRADGFAAESGEYYPDTHSLAVPVHDSLGVVQAALAVLGSRREVTTGSRPADGPMRALRRASGAVGRAVADLA